MSRDTKDQYEESIDSEGCSNCLNNSFVIESGRLNKIMRTKFEKSGTILIIVFYNLTKNIFLFTSLKQN